MAINKYEKKKIEDALRAKLSGFGFAFGEVEISEGRTKNLILRFKDATHVRYKNVRLMSHDSEITETTLYTRAKLSIRFLHGELKSPVIGMKIVTYTITIS
jgi:hypothetical protein